MIAPDPWHHWQVYSVPPTIIPGGAQTAVDGHTAGVFGPQMSCSSTVGGPWALQQFAADGPVAPPHVWLFRLQHPHVGQSASVLHADPPPATVVVVVEPPVSVVVVASSPSVVVVVPRGEIAEPQQTTSPLLRQVRMQHVLRLRLQVWVARRRQNFRRLTEQVASRGSAAAQDATVSRHDVRHCRQTGFGFAAAVTKASGGPSNIATTNMSDVRRSDRMARRLRCPP
jgi:hypothetical protein